MPAKTEIIYEPDRDLYVNNLGGTWAAARGDYSTSGTTYSTTATSYNWAVRVSYSTRFGGQYLSTRSFFEWDSIGTAYGGHVNKAWFSIKGDKAGGTESSAYNVRAVICPSPLESDADDFGNIFDGVGNIVALTLPVLISSTVEQFWTFNFTDSGIQAIHEKIYNGDKITIALINELEFDNLAPLSSGANHKFYYVDSSDEPTLTIEWSNPSMFGANF